MKDGAKVEKNAKGPIVVGVVAADDKEEEQITSSDCVLKLCNYLQNYKLYAI